MNVLKKGKSAVAVAFALVALMGTGFADTLVLNDGSEVSGYYEGGTSRVIRFRTDDGVNEYDLLRVRTIRFGGDVVSSAPRIVEPVAVASDGAPRITRNSPATPATTAPANSDVRLQTRDEAAGQPTASSAAATAWTIPTGARLLVRMNQAVDSEQDAAGATFTANLEDPLMVQGIEVAPRGAAIRGRIAQLQSAGRVRGSAELGLELTQIVVNGVPYVVHTAEYSEVADGRGGETAQRVGTAAGIGAIIGAIAGGGQGAAIGAGVGAGAAGTVQVLTKGEKLYIPAETLLGFTLNEPLIIAAR